MYPHGLVVYFIPSFLVFLFYDFFEFILMYLSMHFHQIKTLTYTGGQSRPNMHVHDELSFLSLFYFKTVFLEACCSLVYAWKEYQIFELQPI